MKLSLLVSLSVWSFGSAFSQTSNCIYIELLTNKIKDPFPIDVYVEQCNVMHQTELPVPSAGFVPLYLYCDSISDVRLIFDITYSNNPLAKELSIGYGTFTPGDSVIFDFDKKTKTIIGNVNTSSIH